jgi:hypothetical protein
MKYDPTKALRPFHNVRAMIRGIPRQLWDIFLPESLTGLPGLESSILALRTREVDRKKVIAIQQMCGFPLRPNAPLREMAAKVKILRMKRRKHEKGGSDSDTAEQK